MRCVSRRSTHRRRGPLRWCVPREWRATRRPVRAECARVADPFHAGTCTTKCAGATPSFDDALFARGSRYALADRVWDLTAAAHSRAGARRATEIVWPEGAELQGETSDLVQDLDVDGADVRKGPSRKGMTVYLVYQLTSIHYDGRLCHSVKARPSQEGTS
jgi:hypothetical protein